MMLWIVVSYIVLGIITSMYMIHFYKVRMMKIDPLYLTFFGSLVWPIQIIKHLWDIKGIKEEYGRTPYSKPKEKVIYRIENPDHMHGMWYDHKGEYDPVIHDLCPNALAREFPMPYDETHFFNDKKWYSAAKSINNMHQWFNRSDAINLINNGFRLFKFRVSEWREFEYEVHFTREGVVEQTEIEVDSVWEPGN